MWTNWYAQRFFFLFFLWCPDAVSTTTIMLCVFLGGYHFSQDLIYGLYLFFWLFLFVIFFQSSTSRARESETMQRPGHVKRRLAGEAVIINNWQHHHSSRTTLNASARHNTNYFLSFRLPLGWIWRWRTTDDLACIFTRALGKETRDKMCHGILCINVIESLYIRSVCTLGRRCHGNLRAERWLVGRSLTCLGIGPREVAVGCDSHPYGMNFLEPSVVLYGYVPTYIFFNPFLYVFKTHFMS